MQESFSGGPSLGPPAAPKGRRFASAVIDLFVIPIILGVLIGIALINAPETSRSIILVLVNIIWLLFRDTVFSPGRKLVGLKLVSLTGDRVTIGQAFIRNVLLLIPFVLLIGYFVETGALIAKGERVADGWAKTRVVLA